MLRIALDKNRLVIRGGSAGGLTVLRALQISDQFAGGTSLYGVTDLEGLAADTHKFESRYLDGLLGGPYPEFKSVYQERSPIYHADELSSPILVLQGDEVSQRLLWRQWRKKAYHMRIFYLKVSSMAFDKTTM